MECKDNDFIDVCEIKTKKKAISHQIYRYQVKLDPFTMDAFILAAGLGTRLRPLTDSRPKALLPVGGMTLLDIAIGKMTSLGISHIVINVHHFAEMIIEHVARRYKEVNIEISDERNLLLDTGGALSKAAPLFADADDILVYNVDILSSFDIGNMAAFHKQHHSMATLAVSQRNTSRQLLVDDEGRLTGWQNLSTGESISSSNNSQHSASMAFSGITMIRREIFPLLPTADHPFPIIPEYLRIADDWPVYTYRHDPSQWLDVGKPETIAVAQSFLSKSTA